MRIPRDGRQNFVVVINRYIEPHNSRRPKADKAEGEQKSTGPKHFAQSQDRKPSKRRGPLVLQPGKAQLLRETDLHLLQQRWCHRNVFIGNQSQAQHRQQSRQAGVDKRSKTAGAGRIDWFRHSPELHRKNQQEKNGEGWNNNIQEMRQAHHRIKVPRGRGGNKGQVLSLVLQTQKTNERQAQNSQRPKNHRPQGRRNPLSPDDDSEAKNYETQRGVQVNAAKQIKRFGDRRRQIKAQN